MKTCTKCLVEKSDDSFSKNGSNGMHTSCKQCRCDYEKSRRAANLDVFKELEKAQYEKHKAAKAVRMADYHSKNKEKRLLAEKMRYAEKSEHIKASNAAYRKANMPKVYAMNGMRRARCRNATPSWANLSAIAALYDDARKMTEATGITYHVDHIFPLQGRMVSGLHVEANLRVIPAKENLRKGSRVLCE